MQHPETMYRLARDRMDTFRREAEHERWIREARDGRDATSSQERPETDRFGVRNLRWPAILRRAGT
jgi:hypothetical protein